MNGIMVGLALTDQLFLDFQELFFWCGGHIPGVGVFSFRMGAGARFEEPTQRGRVRGRQEQAVV